MGPYNEPVLPPATLHNPFNKPAFMLFRINIFLWYIPKQFRWKTIYPIFHTEIIHFRGVMDKGGWWHTQLCVMILGSHYGTVLFRFWSLVHHSVHAVLPVFYCSYHTSIVKGLLRTFSEEVTWINIKNCKNYTYFEAVE